MHPSELPEYKTFKVLFLGEIVERKMPGRDSSVGHTVYVMGIQNRHVVYCTAAWLDSSGEVSYSEKVCMPIDQIEAIRRLERTEEVK